MLLRFSIKVTTFPKHRRSYRDKNTQPFKNHEVLSYSQNLNQKGTKSPRHFPNGNQTHPYILLCYGPTTQKKSWLKFVSIRGILLSSSLNSVKTPPGNTHKRTQKFSHGRAHRVSTGCLLCAHQDERCQGCDFPHQPTARGKDGEAGVVFSLWLS